MVSYLGTLILCLIIGFYYDYRLTLILLCLMPFILGEMIVINSAKKVEENQIKKLVLK